MALEDVTEVVAAREALDSVSRRLLATQEEERKRIASDLHNSTSQHLVAIGLNLRRLVSPRDGEAPVIFRELEESLDHAFQEIRSFTYLLHPPGLGTEGLRAVLKQFLAGFGRRTGLKIGLKISPRIDLLPVDLQRSVLRIVQEALLNVHRHADASKVTVHARIWRETLVLKIMDDGCGIGVDGAAGRGEHSFELGVGIPGMRARLRHFGGELTIRTGRTGTTLMATAPVRGAVHAVSAPHAPGLPAAFEAEIVEIRPRRPAPRAASLRVAPPAE